MNDIETIFEFCLGFITMASSCGFSSIPPQSARWVMTLAKKKIPGFGFGRFGQKMYPSDWSGVGAEGRHLEGPSDQCRTSVHHASALLSRGVQGLGIIQRTME
jgi:hypothetical protein